MSDIKENTGVESAELRKLYHALLLADTPFIDLRAPVEFAQGAFPSSHSLPLMSDNERRQVGTCYKQQGQAAAIALGHQLVAGDIQNRIDKWVVFKKENPAAWLYCFRGGLRSRLSAQFLKDNGVDINIVPGGYKALRRYLIETIEQAAKQPLTVIGGKTGSAKTQLIQELANGLDIEGMANHRGSSFGKQVTPQPRQINYENQLAVEVLKISEHRNSFILEDESRTIGGLSVPLPLFNGMCAAPMVVIDDPLEIRLHRLCNEYCTIMQNKFVIAFGEESGWRAYHDYLHKGLYGIHKRLGLERFKVLDKILDDALNVQKSSGSSEAHIHWIAPILKSYYDPMYQYQLSKKMQRIQFTGSSEEVKEWLLVNQK
ncbi:MAG: tRNA 2-selenouridine(34) synthase MnmH [Psychromonas sp.]|nr:tRNA 2-selenouridine(34) synthase MnmH [Psychromonas sp.]